MKRIGIIPARFGSTRFPGKPLALIGGLSMIERVYIQAAKADLDQVVVATDHEDIAAEVKRFGGIVAMTDSALPSGTDRCKAALDALGMNAEVVINIQGDEPFIDPAQINQVLHILEQPGCDIATLISPCLSSDELHNPNRVKAVVDKNGKALYFSRQAIPYLKANPPEKWQMRHKYYIHLGIYGFHSSVLHKIVAIEEGLLEKAESLEQLRWLENGYSIYTAVTDIRSDSVDTPEDLKEIEKKFFL